MFKAIMVKKKGSTDNCCKKKKTLGYGRRRGCSLPL
jgi:hypothetical protein